MENRDQQDPITVWERSQANIYKDKEYQNETSDEQTDHSWITPSYGEIIDESDFDLFHVRVRKREELGGPPEETKTILKELFERNMRKESPVKWHETFDFMDRLRRVLLYNLKGIAPSFLEIEETIVTEVIPFIAGTLRDKRVSVSRNSVETLSDLFFAFGPYLKKSYIEAPLAVVFELVGGSATTLKDSSQKAIAQGRYLLS
jgi:hypothetical protein